ncbi:hypothetical protein AWZ03_009055 [Drosophila navojoa]|uniref:Uncharacterized protein n=1 Tax=Drosophila navojoa TaxID=7232 RepID=A0A484B757_DRONA|nr:hypothetical protein AWZ03_009055 [Drosophila navojoa]
MSNLTDLHILLLLGPYPTLAPLHQRPQDSASAQPEFGLHICATIAVDGGVCVGVGVGVGGRAVYAPSAASGFSIPVSTRAHPPRGEATHVRNFLYERITDKRRGVSAFRAPPKAAKIKFSKQSQLHAYRQTDSLYDGGTDTDDDECPLESTTMNPYEFESTLDCRDTGGGPCPGTLPMTGRHAPTAGAGGSSGVHSQTLQHQQQNQQNLQAAAAAAAAAAQQSSHYDYEYQHLPHRPPDTTANSTAQRTHGRQDDTSAT